MKFAKEKEDCYYTVIPYNHKYTRERLLKPKQLFFVKDKEQINKLANYLHTEKVFNLKQGENLGFTIVHLSLYMFEFLSPEKLKENKAIYKAKCLEVPNTFYDFGLSILQNCSNILA